MKFVHWSLKAYQVSIVLGFYEDMCCMDNLWFKYLSTDSVFLELSKYLTFSTKYLAVFCFKRCFHIELQRQSSRVSNRNWVVLWRPEGKMEKYVLFYTFNTITWNFQAINFLEFFFLNLQVWAEKLFSDKFYIFHSFRKRYGIWLTTLTI